ncbi:hypothetical protein NDU88_001393 [Pleurodeles waltl]|uniref:Uncharacterized protein n=1 Tax=Pleurodeles waltl TaxID=8319 RepID=A0AAV7P6X2_PLEWA|nr:hypothetical protein NDU88_001393 [Pleurodeles waltl]
MASWVLAARPAAPSVCGGTSPSPPLRILTRAGPGPLPDASSRRSPGCRRARVTTPVPGPSAGRQAREIRPRRLTQLSGFGLLLTPQPQAPIPHADGPGGGSVSADSMSAPPEPRD